MRCISPLFASNRFEQRSALVGAVRVVQASRPDEGDKKELGTRTSADCLNARILPPFKPYRYLTAPLNGAKKRQARPVPSQGPQASSSLPAENASDLLGTLLEHLKAEVEILTRVRRVDRGS